MLLVAGHPVRLYRVTSSSMEPTLHCAGAPDCRSLRSDEVLVDRLAYLISAPRRGDVVVVRPDGFEHRACQGGRVYVKRIVGLPGERIAQLHGRIYIDGEELRERYVAPWAAGGPDFRGRVVPRNQFFVLGDNRRYSCDSRQFGAVPAAAILGRVELVYWPPGRIGRL
jgi:signal peptidase I